MFFDIRIGYLGVIVLPIVLWFLFKVTSKTLFLYLILSISFLAGSFDLLFNISINYILMLLEIVIIVFTMIIIYNTWKTVRLPYLIGFLTVCVFSFILNDVSLIQLLLFLRMYLRIVIVYTLYLNLKLECRDANNLLKFIILLYVSQIFVSFGKYLIVGQTEAYIGTMSVLGGSLTAIFSLIGIAFAFSAFLYEGKSKYLLLMLLFVLFSFIGGKRVIIFFAPALILLQYLYYSRKTGFWKIVNWVKILPIIVSIFICMYIGIRIFPLLNPENMIWGSFDLNYAANQVEEYLFDERPIKGVQHYSRGYALAATYELLIGYGWEHLLFGLGPGDIIMSRFTIPMEIIGSEDMIAGIKYGIGYGSRTGLLFTTLQIGLVGFIFYFLLIHSMFREVKNRFYREQNNKLVELLLLGYIGTYWVFIFDYFMYSREFTERIPLLMTVFFVDCYTRNTRPKEYIRKV